MKILLLSRYGRLGASSRLRTLQYIQFLESRGASVDVSPFFSNGYVSSMYAKRSVVIDAMTSYARRIVRLTRADEYDLVWTEKELLPWVAPGIEKFLSRGAKRLVVDIDDAVFHRYDQHNSRLVRSVLRTKIDRVMARSSLVIAGNEYLGERARAAGASQVAVVPTVVDLCRYSGVRANFDRDDSGDFIVGWIGSPSTAHYLRSIANHLPEIVHGRKIRYLAIGARQDQLEGTPFSAVDWSEDREVDLLSNLSVGIMPLLDTPWERGKCGYKLIQYMACGIPVIASPVGVNESIAGAAGIFASDGDDWRAAIETLAAAPDMCRAMGAAGRQRVEETYSLQAQAPRLERLLSIAASR